MEENNENIAQPKNSTKKIEKTLFEFVESLFDGQGKKLSNGDISIEMEGTLVSLSFTYMITRIRRPLKFPLIAS